MVIVLGGFWNVFKYIIIKKQNKIVGDLHNEDKLS